MAVPDNNWIPAAVFGGALVLLGSGMILSHRKNRLRQLDDDTIDDADWSHLTNRHRRRMQTSAMVVLVGAMIAGGDALVWNLGPLPSTLYWMFVIFLVCWIAILALGDMTAIQVHARVTREKYEATRKQLEEELAQHRARNNGRQIDNSRDSE